MTTMEFFAGWLRGRLGRDERGASLVEYALLLSFIALACIAALGFLGNNTNEFYSSAANAVGSAN